MRSIAVRIAAAGAGLAAALYASWAGTTWHRYGEVMPSAEGEKDPLLDRFMPRYEIAERHQVRVGAPAEITLSAAADIDLRRSAIIDAIFTTREVILRSEPGQSPLSARPAAERASARLGRAGGSSGAGDRRRRGDAAVDGERHIPSATRRGFAAFNEPGYAKIVWTLRVDPTAVSESIARTETRVTTTDALSRAKFRRYWSFVSPGVVLIRRISLRLVKAEAERRCRELNALPSAAAYSPSKS